MTDVIPCSESGPVVSDAGRWQLGVAVTALSAGAIGAVANALLSGWLSVAVMAVTGVVFLLRGLTEVRWASVFDLIAKRSQTATVRTAAATTRHVIGDDTPDSSTLAIEESVLAD